MNATSAPLPEVIDCVAVDTVAARLRAGDTFVELRHPNIAARAATLNALLTQVEALGAKTIWVGNPLRSPLTIERLFLQTVGPDADARLERDPAKLSAMLHRALADTPRCLIIVQQPETMDAEAREVLASLEPFFDEALTKVQFLFCCGAGFQPIRPTPPKQALALAAAPPTTEARSSSSRETVPLLLLLLVASLGAMLTSSAADPEAPVPPTAAAPTAAAAVPRRIETPPRPVVPAMVNLDALRREFEAFLLRQPPRVSALSQADRDALFEEFLARRARPADPDRL